jgi:hypothetical protein
MEGAKSCKKKGNTNCEKMHKCRFNYEEILPKFATNALLYTVLSSFITVNSTGYNDSQN